MGRTRRSTTSYFRRAPYNLRSRSRVPNYLNTIGSEDSSATEVKDLPKLESVDLQDAENSTAHHTNMYDEHVVFRRAQSFKIKMTLTKSLSEDQSGSMIFSTGRTPYPSKGNLCIRASVLNQCLASETLEPNLSECMTFTITCT